MTIPAWAIPPSDVEYRFNPPPEKWSEEMKARFKIRFTEVKAEVTTQYENAVRDGRIDTDTGLEECFHKILSTLAREFGLNLLVLTRRQ